MEQACKRAFCDRIVNVEGSSVSSIDRVLGLIELFTEARPIWTAEALIQTQATSRATTYRDLKALVASGFLAPVAAGAYALGPNSSSWIARSGSQTRC